MTSRDSRLKILCLHGYQGSAAILQRQMAGLRDTFESEADLVFVDAPTLATGGFGWWHAVTDLESKEAEDPGVFGLTKTIYEGWDQSLAFLLNTFKNEGPFDGVLGFSQGGALAGLAAALAANKEIPSPKRELHFRFAIEFGGFPAADPRLHRLYEHEASIDIPSLHVIGRRDTIVPPERTLALSQKFLDAQVFFHDDGHIIPSTPEMKSSLKNFLMAVK